MLINLFEQGRNSPLAIPLSATLVPGVSRELKVPPPPSGTSTVVTTKPLNFTA